MKQSLYEASLKGDRLEQLVQLRDILAVALDGCESMRDLAALARQYRETLKEIDELEGDTNKEDDIAQLLSQRSAEGKAGAVRQSRSSIQ